MKIIKYETPIFDLPKEFGSEPIVFLAGPTVRGNQRHLTSWRRDAEAEFERQGFKGVLISPEFEDKTESDQYRYDIPQWEFFGLKYCDVIMFWVARTRELIGLTTNFELGYWIAKEPSKIVYGRPHDAYRVKYSDIMWDRLVNASNPTNRPIFNELKDTVSEVIKKITNKEK